MTEAFALDPSDMEADAALLSALDLAESDMSKLPRHFAHLLTQHPRELYLEYVGLIGGVHALLGETAELLNTTREEYVNAIREQVLNTYGMSL